ncbi:MAG: hypothetical protein GX351_01390 [Peptococcaceae bacterium]|nr:hypothetical protein [Peptococcaceae bacterium]
MQEQDQKLLDSFERIFKVLKNESENLKDIKSVHIEKIRQLENEVRTQARIIEEISLPARLILEHILELKYKSGQIAIESEYINQSFSNIYDVKIEQFGLIIISTGDLELCWKDNKYNYLIYPDKVEIRNADEKSTIKLFFSRNFGRQIIYKFSAIIESSQLHYLHPTLKNYIDETQFN